ncbi:hypothetical protein HYW20_04575 [Candidatus Woesearchaeota archaeon]|nr:hypothetical protein [Candidatus Woesearchaeota archaeon]
MGWKDWPYWLKGGVIVLGIYLIATLSLLPFGETGGNPRFPLWLVPSLFPLFILIEILGDVQINPYIISPIFYFLIGSLIGWIVGKFKSKNVQ